MRHLRQVACVSETYCHARKLAVAWIGYSITVHKLLCILLSKDAHGTHVGCATNMVFSRKGKFLPTSMRMRVSSSLKQEKLPSAIQSHQSEKPARRKHC